MERAQDLLVVLASTWYIGNTSVCGEEWQAGMVNRITREGGRDRKVRQKPLIITKNPLHFKHKGSQKQYFPKVSTPLFVYICINPQSSICGLLEHTSHYYPQSKDSEKGCKNQVRRVRGTCPPPPPKHTLPFSSIISMFTVRMQ